MKKGIYLFLLLTFIGSNSYSQKIYDDFSIFPFAGLNVGKYYFANIGFCYSRMTLEEHYPTSYNLFIAAEIGLDKNSIAGPKIGCWITYGYFATGLSLIYYTNSKTNSLTIRPEVGAEIKRFKLTYGYNLKIQKSILDEINTHLIELSYSFRRKIYFTKKLK